MVGNNGVRGPPFLTNKPKFPKMQNRGFCFPLFYQENRCWEPPPLQRGKSDAPTRADDDSTSHHRGGCEKWGGGGGELMPDRRAQSLKIEHGFRRKWGD